MDILDKYYAEIEDLRKFKNKIIEKTEKEELKCAKELMRDYRQKFKFDIEIYYLEASILLKENMIDEAKQQLLEGLRKKAFNFTLNYELAKLYKEKREVNKSLDYYLEAMRCLDDEEKEKENLLNEVDELLHLIDVSLLDKSDLEHIKTRVGELNQLSVGNKISEKRYFPVETTMEGDRYLIGDFLYKRDKEGYYVNYYDSTEFENIALQFKNEVKTEILYGSLITEKNISLIIEAPCAIPISVKEKQTILKMEINGEEYILKDMIPDRFYYFPIKEKCQLKINSNNDFFLGNKLLLEDNNDTKIVLFIFIDGLSQKLLDGNNLNRLMPYTGEFFDDGTKATNCHINGGWTLTSFANIFTGKYTVNHEFFNLKLSHKNKLGDDVPLLSQVFQKNGYMTLQVNGNWAINPNFGYAKGFDRTIYNIAGLGDMRTSEMVMNTIEHISAFKDRSHFVYLSLYELHNVTDNLKLRLPVQLENNIHTLTDVKEKEKSLRLRYNPKKVKKYRKQVSQIDRELKILYDYIDENYNQDEVLVALVSDHGQTFLSNKSIGSTLTRTRVPFMIKGRNVPSGYCNELVENIDIFPTILKYAEINYSGEIDGCTPKFLGGDKEKKYTFTDNMYRGQRYKAYIHDDTHLFIFKTENFVESDGRVDIINSNVVLVNKETEIIETEIYKEKVDEYISIVFKHIRENIKI